MQVQSKLLYYACKGLMNLFVASLSVVSFSGVC
jgi:hypothetical protein